MILVLNIGTDSGRTPKGVRFGFEECYISPDKVIDYSDAKGMPKDSMTAPISYIMENLTEEEFLEYHRITRKLQDIIVEYTTNPPVVEEPLI